MISVFYFQTLRLSSGINLFLPTILSYSSTVSGSIGENFHFIRSNLAEVAGSDLEML